jgi:EmrB/QacA subfamily drug resistance transporter
MAGRIRIDDGNRRWWVLAAAGMSLIVVALDETMVGVALPTIRDEFGMSQTASQWVVNAYVLALTAFVAAGGRLGDIVGHRPMYVGGAVVLAAGTLVVGFAQSSVMILAGRAIQGLGSATLFAIALAMIGIAFRPGQRGIAFGIYGLMGASANFAAPLVAGALTDFASWRLMFFASLPVVIATATIVALAWRERERDSSHRPSFDTRGFVLLVLVLVPLVFALMQAPDWGWGSAGVVALLALSALALPIFVATERRVREPLVNLNLVRNPTVAGSDLIYFAGQFTKLAVLIFGALYLQDRLGFSPLEAGAALLAATIPLPMTAILAGRLTDRYGARTPMLGGTAAMIASLVWMAVVIPSENYVLLAPGFVVWGLSLNFFYTPPQTAIMNAVPAGSRGEAAGVAATARMLGGTLAVAILGSVLVATDSFAAVLWVTAGVTIAIWIAAYLLVERSAGGGAAPAPTSG